MTDPTLPSALARARRAVVPFDLPDTLAEVALSDAYVVQDAYAAAVAPEAGGIAGFKLGANSPGLLAHFGIEEPISAQLFGDEIYPSGVELRREAFQAVSIELELAATLGPDVADITAPVDRAGAEALIEHYRPAIELLDLRGKSLPTEPLANTVALNAYSAGCVLGESRRSPAELDIGTLEVTLTIDGKEVTTVTGTAPQPPAEAVMWLINDLAKRGHRPTPGMVVICGSFIPLMTLEDGVREVAVEMTGFGDARFTLTG